MDATGHQVRKSEFCEAHASESTSGFRAYYFFPFRHFHQDIEDDTVTTLSYKSLNVGGRPEASRQLLSPAKFQIRLTVSTNLSTCRNSAWPQPSCSLNPVRNLQVWRQHQPTSCQILPARDVTRAHPANIFFCAC